MNEFNVSSAWLSPSCITTAFPFNHIENDEDFLDCVLNNDYYSSASLSEDLKLELSSSDCDSRSLLNNIDIDPDHNYLTDLPFNSTYSSPLSLGTKFNPLQPFFTVLHVNCRSVLPKLTEIKNLILRLPVSVLALSETWLADSLEDLVDLSGYQFIHRARQNGQGEVVGLLIQEDISFQIIIRFI